MSKYVIGALLLASLAGCGQKGPLYEQQAPTTNQPSESTDDDKKESK